MASEIGAGLGAPPPSSISSSGAPAGLVVACVFNDALHQVQVAILPAALVLKIQDDVTGEEWTGSFTTAYVEDMTARTGNFKSFTTFTAMLTRSLSHPTPQLQLHWLTYRALQRLRSQPAPSEPELASFESSQGLDAADPTASRRYLILTYTSEFDRTHYPLPLECAAPPTVGALAARLRHLHHDNQQLRQALDAARSQPTPPPTEHPDAPANKGASKDSPLTAIVEAQMQEIDELRQIISQQRTDLEALHQTVAQRPRGPSAQDLDMLRTMISQLEHDLLEQKNRHQSLVAGKNTQLQRLRAELEAVSANERALQLKCRNLSAQLHARSASTPQRRSNPVGSTGKAPASGPRPRAAAVEERRASASRSRSASRPANTRQAASTEPRGRDRSRSRSVSVHDRAVSRTGAARQSTPSRRTRSASPRPRFDPTAYVKERQAKIEAQRQRRTAADEQRRGRSPSPAPRSRTASFRGPSRGSSRSSSVHRASRGPSRSPSVSARGRRHDDGPRHGARPARSPSFDYSFKRREQGADTSAPQPDIAEIDRRLQALQAYLNQSS